MSVEAFEQFFNRMTDKSAVSPEEDRKLYALGERTGMPKIVIRALYFFWREFSKEGLIYEQRNH
jgi:hypothetical protein